MENINPNQNLNPGGQPNTVPESGQPTPGFIDILNMPVDKAFVEIVKLGGKAVQGVKQKADETFQKIADEEYAKICRPVLTMDECLAWLKLQKVNYPQAAYFFIYTEQNPSPRNENDLFSVAIALVDTQKKAIPVTCIKKTSLFASSAPKEQDIVCMVIPTKTMDTKLLKALNGGSSVLIKL